MKAVRRADQLHRDPHPVARSAHAAFQQAGHREPAADRAGIVRGVLDLKGGRASRHAQARVPGEHVEQFLGQPIREVLLIAFGTENREVGERRPTAGAVVVGSPPRRDVHTPRPRASRMTSTPKPMPTGSTRLRDSAPARRPPSGRVAVSARSSSQMRQLDARVADVGQPLADVFLEASPDEPLERGRRAEAAGRASRARC